MLGTRCVGDLYKPGMFGHIWACPCQQQHGHEGCSDTSAVLLLPAAGLHQAGCEEARLQRPQLYAKLFWWVCTGHCSASMGMRTEQAAQSALDAVTADPLLLPPGPSASADQKGKFDEVVEEHGVRLLIDPAALMHVLGTTMDYIDEPLK